MLLACLGLASPAAWSQAFCAVPGSDPTPTATGVVNSYFDGTNQATLSSNATSLVLGASRAGSATATVSSGDLLIVMQMQDAVIDSSNSANYGSNTGNGRGSTNPGNAGLYEYVRATSAGGAGATISFTPALTHTYRQAAATASQGQRRYQVIRVPQYAAVTLQGVTAPAWNGLAGGVVAVDASQDITLGSATVEGQTNRAIFLGGKGFRGAAGFGSTAASQNNPWVFSDATSQAHGGKAEGIAGTPRYVAVKTDGWGFGTTNRATDATLTRVDNGVSGYPDGDRAKGAPGNAGGGGVDGGSDNNQFNAGGGGGGSYARGGIGGRPYNRPLIDSNGRGGDGYAGVLTFGRVFLGGGGGAGTTNNALSENAAYENDAIACNITGGPNGNSPGAKCSSGGAGGGIAILRARTVGGSGVIDVRGAHGYNVGNDSGGGGGAAGAVVLHVIDGGSADVNAAGGHGGNAWAGRPSGGSVCGTGSGATATADFACRHGPGGGGGGGFVAFSPASLALNANLDGGVPGRTTNGPTDTYEATGFNGGLSTFITPDTPGIIPGALCLPDLRLAKSNGIDVLLTSGTTTYSLTVSNVASVPTTGAITVVDVLPTQLSIADGAVALSGSEAANWACTAAANVVTCTSATSISASGSSTFGFTADVSAANGVAITNRARVGGGGDVDNPTPDATNTALCTGDHTPIGCAIDTDVTNAPFLGLTKSASNLVAGNAGSYTLTLMNMGSQPTSGTVRVVDVLPTGVTFSGFASPSGFTCVHLAPNVVCESSTVIPVGGSATITINVNVAASAPSAVVNRARVGGGGDPVKPGLPDTDGSNTSTCPAPVAPAASASNSLSGCASVSTPVRRIELALAKSDGQNFMPQNGQTTYSFTVSNVGNADSIGTISFRDELPSPLTFPATLTVGGPNAADWSCVRDDGDTATCSSSTVIAAGGSSTFSLVVNVNAIAVDGTIYANRARIAGGGDPDLLAGPLSAANVTGCTGNNVGPGCALDANAGQAAAQIRLAKSHPNPQARSPGETFAFNLVVSNSGGVASTGDITVVDVLPSGLSFSSTNAFVSGGFNCTVTTLPAPGFVTCVRAAALAAGATATITFDVVVGASVPPSLTNRAQVGGGGDPQNGTTPTAASAALCSANGTPALGCALDTVPLNADLAVIKTNSTTNVETGENTTYTLTVTNNGPGNAHGAVLTDTPSAGLVLSAVDCIGASGGAVCPIPPNLSVANLLGGGVVIPTLPAGSTITFQVVANVTATGLP
jgi:uncharacterized repeat protein (TIGR01451 family)